MHRPFPAYRGDAPYIFVSYAHDDAETVYAELQWLKAQGFNVWYDEGISPGSSWRDEVALALTQSALFLYYLSPRSIRSDNCQQELNFALSRERRVLAVHLEPTQLSMGVELGLSNKQAILRADHTEAAYQQKLTDALRSLLPKEMPDDVAVRARGGAAQQAEKPNDKSIAILPFTNRSSDEENQYLCDGLAEELIGGFAKMEDLRVASQVSTFALKNQNFDIETIGAKLRVNHVLSGSVQKSGNRVRVSVSLTDVRSGDAVWSERYDGTLDDVFGLQEAVARKVVDALQVRLGAAEAAAPLIDAGTRNPHAYNAFLLGMQAFRRSTQRDILEAMDRFQQAGTEDPDFGRAHWFNFICHLILVNDFGAPPQSLQQGRKAAIDAMRRTTFQAPAPRIQIDRWRNRTSTPENELAREAIDKIKHPDPEWASYQYWQLAMSLGAAGLIGGCLDYMKLYVGPNPRHAENSNAFVFYVTALELLGRYDEAIDHYTELLAVNPDAPLNIGSRGMLYSRTGQYEKAEQDLAAVAKVFPRNFGQFYHLYWTRQVDAAREYYTWMNGQPRLNWVFKCWAALLMGDLDRGLDYLETQVERTGSNPWAVKCVAVRPLPHSTVSEVWAHPRHKAMMERDGVTDAWRDGLLIQVNELTPITGVIVRPDEVV